MKDDLRDLLRANDPARGREMSALERARIEATLSAAAPRPSRPWAPILAMGIVTAALLIVGVFSIPRPAKVQGTSPAPAPEPVPAVAQVEPARSVTTASRPSRRRRAQARPAADDVTSATTRIEFTAPEGTRILWFVGSPDAKELGS